jgi:peptide-methionine (S)-S-oxide reductase
VVRTRVGYAGGSKKNPTYHSLGGHSETIQIDYDPDQISYEELLAIFWASHNPTQPSYSSQYASIIFTHDARQAEQARGSLEEEATERGTIHTEIVPLQSFTLAEDYHQKYYLQNTPRLMAEYGDIYPDMAEFVASTAVARVNGYVGGNGTPEQLALGLSAEGQALLLRRVR